MSINILLEKQTHKPHMIHRYLKFIRSRENIKKFGYHAHHILPKAKDFFPEYKDLKVFNWNRVFLSPREHYIAHWMLALAFPKTSQSLAFYRMSNAVGKKGSKQYSKSRSEHISQLITYTQSPERNRKISEKLKGKKKTQEHINKLIGHSVSIQTRKKLSEANLGKKRSPESIAKQKETYNLNPNNIDRNKPTLTKEGYERMRQTKLKQQRRWYNNGETNRQFWVENPPPDDSWKLGRIK